MGVFVESVLVGILMECSVCFSFVWSTTSSTGSGGPAGAAGAAAASFPGVASFPLAGGAGDAAFEPALDPALDPALEPAAVGEGAAGDGAADFFFCKMIRKYN